jgi:hypothetical protein
VQVRRCCLRVLLLRSLPAGFSLAAQSQDESWRIGDAVVAELVVALLARIPFLGALMSCAAWLAGVGALVMQVRPKGTTPA